jgi:hypothetical protein
MPEANNPLREGIALAPIFSIEQIYVPPIAIPQ